LSLVDDVRRQVTERLRELKPLVDEYHQLEEMVQKLGDRAASTARRRRTAARRRTTRSTNGRRRRGRPRGSGTRTAQALALVQAKPGITIPEMGKEMGITPNYLYRVLPQLAKDGKVKKSGKGWVPVS
jgi:CRP-like cAMP-binding protein